MTDIYQSLGIEDLRKRTTKHTRKTYSLLRLPNRPRILDIICGRGVQTIKLARLSNGDIVGIDIDKTAFSHLETRIKRESVLAQITVFDRSLYKTGFDNESFDLLWEEGVLHLLDDSRSFHECNRLLKPGGYLVMHETMDAPAQSRWASDDLGHGHAPPREMGLPGGQSVGGRGWGQGRRGDGSRCRWPP